MRTLGKFYSSKQNGLIIINPKSHIDVEYSYSAYPIVGGGVREASNTCVSCRRARIEVCGFRGPGANAWPEGECGA